MGGKTHDPSVVHSSIALLQERFRQLQRVKEMREKRELLKMLGTEPKHFINSIPTMTCDPTRLFFHHELFIPSKSPPHVCLSLWPTSQEDNSSSSTVETTPVSKNVCFTDCTHTQSLQASWKNTYDWNSGSDSGVDTSLHL
ncbi:hypothetical protein SESBI_29553 [Sesbania bispinosa]|nr:hypothetical protein SESBI_29553 [Sesbania bispinosa]